jgi:hypothetical protein
MPAGAGITRGTARFGRPGVRRGGPVVVLGLAPKRLVGPSNSTVGVSSATIGLGSRSLMVCS